MIGGIYIFNVEAKLRSFYDNYIMRDFLGYFTPGAIVIFYITTSRGIKIKKLINNPFTSDVFNDAFVVLLTYLAAYLVGQLCTCISYYLIYRRIDVGSFEKYIDKYVNVEAKEYFLSYLYKALRIKGKVKINKKEYSLFHEYIVGEIYKDDIARLKYLRANSLLLLNRNLSVSLLFIVPLYINNVNSNVHILPKGEMILIIAIILATFILFAYRSVKLANSIKRDIVIFTLKQNKYKRTN